MITRTETAGYKVREGGPFLPFLVQLFVKLQDEATVSTALLMQIKTQCWQWPYFQLLSSCFSPHLCVTLS